MLMGNTASLRYGVPHVQRTKDVDVTILVLDETRKVAPIEAVHAMLRTLDLRAAAAPDDHSFVQTFVEVREGSYQVDVIRGKSRDRPEGTFIDRRTLNAVIQAAVRDRDVWLPSLPDLILMKAWAATDQARHVRQAFNDPTWHEERRRAYHDDVRRLTEHALDRDQLDRLRLEQLLAMMAEHRRTEIRSELVRAGSLEPDGERR
jgi:hypothetical protein